MAERKKQKDENLKRQHASDSPYGETFERWPGELGRDSRQILQLLALLMILTSETLKVNVQLFQLQMLFLVTAAKNRSSFSHGLLFNDNKKTLFLKPCFYSGGA